MSQNSPKPVIPYDRQKDSDRNLRSLPAVCSSQERATPGPMALGTPLTLGFLRKDSFSLDPYSLLSKQLTQHSHGLQPPVPPTSSLLNVRLMSIKLGRGANGTMRFFNPSASCCRVIETCQKQARKRITRPPCQRLSYRASLTEEIADPRDNPFGFVYCHNLCGNMAGRRGVCHLANPRRHLGG